MPLPVWPLGALIYRASAIRFSLSPDAPGALSISSLVGSRPRCPDATALRSYGEQQYSYSFSQPLAFPSADNTRAFSSMRFHKP
jgi:hypothetical protein